jgi:hypothetical protein
MPIAEVIERGREIGIELQPSDIHAARYYMRQAAAKESSSIPQQLLLGGTFVTKRGPGGRVAREVQGSNGAIGGIANGNKSLNGKGTNGTAAGQHQDQDSAAKGLSASEPQSPTALSFEEFEISDDPEATTEDRVQAAPTRRGRKPAQAAAAEPQSSLHTRLQSRLRQATFRDTAREAAEARDEKATIGKALDVAVKSRGKRGPRAVSGETSQAALHAQEAELRVIALRIGTQRVRELLDEMEALAARA